MTREEVLNRALTLSNKSIALVLPTSFGKTRIAIELLRHHKAKTILIVIPRLVLIKSWEDEINKWYPELLDKVTFVTYVSYPKYKDKSFDAICYDECHHLSERCREVVPLINSKFNILLSATINRNMYMNLIEVFNDMHTIRVSVQNAIDTNTIPDPTIIKIPLELDTSKEDQELIRRPKAKNIVHCSYKDRWKYLKDSKLQVHIRCTQLQYIIEKDADVEFYKKLYMKNHNEGIKTKWLREAGDRLRILSNFKLPYVVKILSTLKKKRVLTFCNSIEQTELLGKYCVNSKDSNSLENLALFNKGKVDHITACNMVDEGVNLTNCQIGVFASINSSERMQVQKSGRILRHRNPIIIIPYYRLTREEEIVNKWLEGYNPELIKEVDFNTIKDENWLNNG